MGDGNKKREWRRAMFLADLGLILALFIVLYALSKHWVEPSPEESQDAGGAYISETVVHPDFL